MSAAYYYKVGVVILRASPYTSAHHFILTKALKESAKVCVLIGAADQPRTTTNPWTYDERVEMVKSCISPENLERIQFHPLHQRIYNTSVMMKEIESVVKTITTDFTGVGYFGRAKDKVGEGFMNAITSFFPSWGIYIIPEIRSTYFGSGLRIDATNIRDDYFLRGMIPAPGIPNDETVPSSIREFLYDFIHTKAYADISEEYHKIQSYKDAWAGAPFPPIFNTVDAVVTCNNHILLGIRKGIPGKGLCALPGGFLEQDETVLEGCLRELHEETSIDVDDETLVKYIRCQRVYDYPYRSSRGRTITMVYWIDLPGTLPAVQAADDLEDVKWVNLDDYMQNGEQITFEDHYSIIYNMIGV